MAWNPCEVLTSGTVPPGPSIPSHHRWLQSWSAPRTERSIPGCGPGSQDPAELAKLLSAQSGSQARGHMSPIPPMALVTSGVYFGPLHSELVGGTWQKNMEASPCTLQLGRRCSDAREAGPECGYS